MMMQYFMPTAVSTQCPPQYLRRDVAKVYRSIYFADNLYLIPHHRQNIIENWEHNFAKHEIFIFSHNQRNAKMVSNKVLTRWHF
jgi:hypothetical protein